MFVLLSHFSLDSWHSPCDLACMSFFHLFIAEIRNTSDYFFCFYFSLLDMLSLNMFKCAMFDILSTTSPLNHKSDLFCFSSLNLIPHEPPLSSTSRLRFEEAFVPGPQFGVGFC